MQQEIKRCSICQLDLPIDFFNKKCSSADGYQYNCRECSKDKNKTYYQEHKEVRRKKLTDRRKFLKKLAKQYILERLSSGCVDCGETDVVVLEFDHVTGIKEYNIATLIQRGSLIEKISHELEKCVVRCANCHRRKTATDFNWYKLCNNKT
jgi:hypothetical protein